MTTLFEQLEELPRLLIVSDAPVSRNQGTGTCLIRQLAGYPRKRIRTLHTLPRDQADPDFIDEKLPLARLPRLQQSILRRIAPSQVTPLRMKRSRSHWIRRVAEIVDEFRPESLLSVPFREEGLALSSLVFRAANPECAKIVHLHDWMPRENSGRCGKLLWELGTQTSNRWTLGANLSEEATRLTGVSFETVPIFYDIVPEKTHKPKLKAADRFVCTLVGNVWCDEALFLSAQAWGRLQERQPGLRPIQWFASPWTMKHGWGEKLRIDPRLAGRIEYAGYLAPDDLKTVLAESDLALIPFSTPDTEETNYARFSIPSRVTELTLLGVPQLGITGRRTGLGRFFEDSGFGCCANESLDAVYQLMHRFYSDFEFRLSQNEKTLRFGRKHLDLRKFQKRFHQALTQKETGSGKLPSTGD